MQGIADSVSVMLELLDLKNMKVELNNNMLSIFIEEMSQRKTMKTHERKLLLIYPYENIYILQINTRFSDVYFGVTKELDNIVSSNPWFITKDSPLPQGAYMNYQYKIRSEELAKDMLGIAINFISRDEVV